MKNNVDSLVIQSATKDFQKGNGDLGQKHLFYLKLVEFYAPAFQNSSLEKLKSLSTASYHYFRALLIVDALIDDRSKDIQKSIIVFLPIFEEAVKHLSWIFPLENPFWVKLDSVKREYFETISFEKAFGAGGDASTITENEFLRIATGKSSICYALLDALNLISDSPIVIDELKNSLKNIHIGFQYLDDVDDFKKDITNNQRTYPASLVDEELKSGGYSVNELDIISKYKYLFVSGIATKMISKAKAHYELAASVAEKYGLTSLREFLRREINKCSERNSEIALLIEKTKQKHSKSNSTVTSKRSLDEIIDSGVRYLKNNLDSGSWWNDFVTSAGLGKEWVTAYAGLQIYKIDEAKNVLSSISYVLANSYGSFNSTITEDADSLNFLLAFRKAVHGHCDSQLLDRWLSFMNDQGGWSTYKDSLSLRTRLTLEDSVDLSGWTSPVLCVTAASAYILSFFPDIYLKRDKSINYLIANTNSDGSLDSYWWTSSIYSTAFTILALSKTEKHSGHCLKCCEWIVNQQAQNGSWKHAENQESEFYTALAAIALMEANFGTYYQLIEKSIKWLCLNQTEDGSWKSGRILQIPATDVRDPSKIRRWRKSSFGVNVIIDDHNRIFTSSTVLNALDLFRKLSKS
jgi:hypothetical protein